MQASPLRHPGARSAVVDSRPLSGNHEIDSLGAFALLVRLNFECDVLSFGQFLQASAFHCRDVDEYVSATIIRFDEPVATLAIEEFDDPSHCHRETPSPALPLRPAQRLRPTFAASSVAITVFGNSSIRRKAIEPYRSATSICESGTQSQPQRNQA
jgi:hypothetical protein